jgi:hypothetical protein
VFQRELPWMAHTVENGAVSKKQRHKAEPHFDAGTNEDAAVTWLQLG